MNRLIDVDPRWGITLVRLMVAAIAITAGYAKIRLGLAAVTAGFVRWSIPLASLFAPFILGLETVGGLLLLVGLFTRWVAPLFAFEFVVTSFWVKLRLMGWIDARLDLLLLASMILLALNGGGKAALDDLLESRRKEPRESFTRS